MSDAVSEAKSLVKSLRVFLAVSGVIALIAGLILLIWPAKSAILVTGIVAAYLIVGGIVYLVLGIVAGRGGAWARVGHILLGVVYIVAGIIAFTNLPAATVTLALVTAIFIGISWIVDGVVSLTLMGQDGTKVWTLLYALLGIVAGIVVLFSPLYAAALLWWILGIALVVLGAAQIVRAVTIGKDAKAASAALNG
ncbi:HdeD family acid-resistance protein [Microbacterium sp. ASV81]|uniref:DUF308 domain-containing protein n=1 Tax=Microbacterium capsulatum TaxID=3041921 RepID=A0ABU0XDZ6_9MICO|nr:DUF308 domain-containing protein [Microbacterium sp. ASV81]MDQ4212838.1 DUF308 domain-containing protein [Microbacterium sp. ASV81]